ncbi:MAG: maltose alpha-D-glucosyltransferase [Rhodospirillales bacterium 20-64-7]|nr:MAG: maltose alpha-D-glucosyltransferase [Rhodospirillales bacterium 20-64-7]
MNASPIIAAPDDPLWYKDAVIYQVHIKSFFDSNNDGVGDFPGLIEKLDYIAQLGVNAIWLLPFYPSPRRDDGYDIADYRNVHPEYGTMADVKRFIHEAHKRDIRVITELVVNHTSDQHPWFQRARAAKPGSAHRDFYVWSDNEQKYSGTRIIFVDTEKSNWTWDETAGAYYWHRFFSHQPDLNFDNPRVLKEVLNIMRFWLDLGVDGLRLDAVPYLIERDGTNNENLAETHDVLKQIRSALDEHAPGRMLLAEANQWPEDAQQYFGAGDECHMSFHFPLMPRMYMAIAQEDRFPITDIMRQTPEIPENCQWAIFLRNHDELTLEMVTDSERDYLWDTYAADRRARINLGIRRRLGPLMEHDRRRIELMNGLLLSMPGTPVIYYGDEIGMGDNIHLGDRDGVRTPMQWSPDRNGGFSRASPADLVLPPVMDPIYGFDAVNVEAQAADQHSLLNWMRRMLTVRKRHQSFGRGAQRFLYPGNRKVLAYLRQLPGEDGGDAETILCVYNLSRTAQAVELELPDFAGRVPVDLLGGSGFPPIGRLTYLLTMPPYGFYWFILATEAALPPWHIRPSEPLPELTTLVLRNGARDAVVPAARRQLETDALPPYLKRRRWFASKDQEIQAARLARADAIPGRTMDVLLAEVEVELGSRTERYHLPLGISWDGETSSALPQQLALARVRQGRRMGYLTDAFAIDAFPIGLIRALKAATVVKVEGGEIVCRPTPQLDAIELAETPELRRLSAEQSNSSIIVGQAIVMKLIRRVMEGINPEVEMVRYLTEHGYANTPELLGEIAMVGSDGAGHSMIVAQRFIQNQGDAWQFTLNYLGRFIGALGIGEKTLADEADLLSGYGAFARAVGMRLGELHALLAQPSEDDAFAPLPADAETTDAWAKGAAVQLERALESLAQAGDIADEDAARAARFLLEHRAPLMALPERLAQAGAGSLQTRIHGDFHLGQVLVSTGDAYIIDYEGEPSKPLDVRRAKSSPLRDVAGLLRSFDYAAAAAGQGPDIAVNAQAAPALSRFVEEMSATFLGAYRAIAHEAAPRWVGDEAAEAALLDLFLLEKAAYEICYEAANRPGWLGIPLRGLANVAARLLTEPKALEDA